MRQRDKTRGGRGDEGVEIKHLRRTEAAAGTETGGGGRGGRALPPLPLSLARSQSETRKENIWLS